MRIRVPSHSSSGFTLIELVVVMVLIAIITAVIIPEMKGTFEGELLRSTSRTLVSGLGLAYSQAVSLNQKHRLVIDENGGRYFIDRLVREDEGRGFMPIEGVTGAEGKLDKRIEIVLRDPEEVGSDEDEEQEVRAASIDSRSSNGKKLRDYVTFYPDGRAESTEIRLQDRTGFRMALLINPITARVSVVELERELP